MNPYHLPQYIDHGLAFAAGEDFRSRPLVSSFESGDPDKTWKLHSLDSEIIFALARDQPDIEDYRDWPHEIPMRLVIAAATFSRSFIDELVTFSQYTSITLILYAPYCPPRYIDRNKKIEAMDWLAFRSSSG